MSDEEYFAHHAISNSDLGWLNPEQGGSPAKFLAQKEQGGEEKKALHLERGSLLHMAIFEPEKFIIDDCPRPSEAVCRIIEEVHDGLKNTPMYGDIKGLELLGTYILAAARNYNYGNGKYKEATILDKIVKEGEAYFKFLLKSNGNLTLDKATKELIDRMKQSLEAHPLASKLLFDDSLETYNEKVLFAEHKNYLMPFQIKGKLDKVTIDHENKLIRIIDLKSTSKSLYRFQTAFEYYRIYRQLAHYMLLLASQPEIQKLIKHKDYQMISTVIVAETTGQNLCGVFPVSQLWINKGILERNDLCLRYAWHKKHDLWAMSKEEYENNYELKLEPPETL